ncbi:hypothetical protein [Alkalicoccobacillus porphyridii]|uniref:Uncharacterized protein n=1 Tax=Alkalicoccobacillus porphyridii TaxID=2597270 RepID=A0A553ZXB0_9BACI|nr:hypothetical protein [Alkalicoccobacillus porphyridii]TSB45986.1 hypothetical protein FN960_13865 [Alkalicoccobacillus porphyridii]
MMREDRSWETHPKTRETVGEAFDKGVTGRWTSLTQGGCLTRLFTIIMIVGILLLLTFCTRT